MVKLNTLAVLGATASAIGVFLAIAADRMTTNLQDMTISEALDRGELAADFWLYSQVAIGAGVFLVALSVLNKKVPELRVMRERLEKDFYRKCPGCGEWITKFVSTCSTCGASLPPPTEFQRPGGTSSTSREDQL